MLNHMSFDCQYCVIKYDLLIYINIPLIDPYVSLILAIIFFNDEEGTLNMKQLIYQTDFTNYHSHYMFLSSSSSLIKQYI